MGHRGCLHFPDRETDSRAVCTSLMLLFIPYFKVILNNAATAPHKIWITFFCLERAKVLKVLLCDLNGNLLCFYFFWSPPRHDVMYKALYQQL